MECVEGGIKRHPCPYTPPFTISGMAGKWDGYFHAYPVSTGGVWIIPDSDAPERFRASPGRPVPPPVRRSSANRGSACVNRIGMVISFRVPYV